MSLFVCSQLDREAAEAQIQTSVVVVSSLPRGAAVEAHVIAVLDEPSDRTSCHMTSQIAGGTVECDVLQSSCGRYATASVSLCLRNPAAELTRAEDIMGALVSSVQDALEKTEKNLSALCARVFYQSHNTSLKEIATGTAASPSFLKRRFQTRNKQNFSCDLLTLVLFILVPELENTISIDSVHSGS